MSVIQLQVALIQLIISLGIIIVYCWEVVKKCDIILSYIVPTGFPSYLHTLGGMIHDDEKGIQCHSVWH